MAALVDLAASVKADGRHRYQGTVDLTRDTHEVIDPNLVKKLGAAARAVPFEASIDDRGRLTYLKVMAPAPPGEPKESGQARRLWITSLGGAATFTAPVGAKEAPVGMYAIMFGKN